MNKEKLIEKIDFEINDLINAVSYHPTNKEYINGGLAELLKMKAFIQSEPEEPVFTKSELIKAINDWWKDNETGFCSYYFFQFREVIQDLSDSKYGKNEKTGE